MAWGNEFKDFANAFSAASRGRWKSRGERERDALELERLKLELEMARQRAKDYPADRAAAQELRQLELEAARRRAKNAPEDPSTDPNFGPKEAPAIIGPKPGSELDTPNPGLAGGEKADLMNQPGDAAKTYVSPVTGTFAGKSGSVYGASRYHRFHSGVDLQAPDGSTVVAAYPGKVLGVGYDPGSAKRKTIGYRHELTILGDDGYIYRYAPHGSVSVRPGDVVKAGDPIGTIGNGHLHWEVVPPGSAQYKTFLKGGFTRTVTRPGEHPTLDPATFFGVDPGTRLVAGQPFHAVGTAVAATGIPGRPGLPGGESGDVLADDGPQPDATYNPESPGSMPRRIEDVKDLVRDVRAKNANIHPGTDVFGGTDRTGIPVPTVASTPWAGGVDQSGGPNDFAVRTGRTGQAALELPSGAPTAESIVDLKPNLRPSSTGTAALPDTSGARLRPSFKTLEGGTAATRRGGKGLVTLGSNDRQALFDVSAQLGTTPANLLSVIGYETMGTYNPDIVSPTGYRGLIQFGPNEQKHFGVKPGMSFADQLRGPVVDYLKERGFKPGMGLPEMYSIINAGSLTKDGQPRWGAADANGNLRHHLTLISQQYAPGAIAWLGGETLGTAPAVGLEGHAVPPATIRPNIRPVAIPTPRIRPTIGPMASYARPAFPFANSPVLGMARGGVVPSRDQLAMDTPPDARTSTNIEDRSGYDPTTGFSPDQYSGDGIDTQRGPDVQFDPGSNTGTPPSPATEDDGYDPFGDVISAGHHAVQVAVSQLLGVDTSGASLAGGEGSDTLSGGDSTDITVYDGAPAPDSGDVATPDAAGDAADAAAAADGGDGEGAIPVPGTKWDALPAAKATDPDVAKAIAAMEQKVDPNGDMPEGQRHMYALGLTYKYFRDTKHNRRAAEESAREIVSYYNEQFNQWQAVAEGALESGNIDDAVKAAVKAWNAIPDNATMEVDKAEGGFRVTYTDNNGAVVHAQLLSPQEISAQILQMNPKTFYRQIVEAGGGHMPSDEFNTAREKLARTGRLSQEDLAKVPDPGEVRYLVKLQDDLTKTAGRTSAADRQAEMLKADKAGLKAVKDHDLTPEELGAMSEGARATAQKYMDTRTKQGETGAKAAAVEKAAKEWDATQSISAETTRELARYDGAQEALDKYISEKSAAAKRGEEAGSAARAATEFGQKQAKEAATALGPAKIFSPEESNTVRQQINDTVGAFGPDVLSGFTAPQQLVMKGAAYTIMQYHPDLPVETAVSIAYDIANGTGKYTAASIPGDKDHVNLTDTESGRVIRIPRPVALDLTRVQKQLTTARTPPPAPAAATRLPTPTPESLFPTPGQPPVTRPSEVRQ